MKESTQSRIVDGGKSKNEVYVKRTTNFKNTDQLNTKPTAYI